MINVGYTCSDDMRFFHGDHPEQQFESGNKHGGHFPCPCGCPVAKFKDIRFSLRRKLNSLEQTRVKVKTIILRYIVLMRDLFSDF